MMRNLTALMLAASVLELSVLALLLLLKKPWVRPAIHGYSRPCQDGCSA